MSNADMLATKLMIAANSIKELVEQIKEIENDQTITPTEKLAQIKNIREEIKKVGTEIDNLKKEVTFLSSNQLN